MGEKLTVRQLAVKTGADPQFLLSKLRDSGLTGQKLDDVIDSDATEKLMKSMVRPKGTLSKKNYKTVVKPQESRTQRTDASRGKPTSQNSHNTSANRNNQPSGGKTGGWKPGGGKPGEGKSGGWKPGGGKPGEGKSGGWKPGGGKPGEGKTGGWKPGGGKPSGGQAGGWKPGGGKPSGGQAGGWKPGGGKPSGGQAGGWKPGGGKPGGTKFGGTSPNKQTPNKQPPRFKTTAPPPSFKDKQNKNKSKLAVDPRAEKASQRYGVKISEEDAMEIRDLIREQKVEDVADMSSSALRRVVNSGRNRSESIENKHKFVKPNTPVAKEITIAGDISFSELAQKLTIKKKFLFGRISKMGLIENPEDHNDESIIEKDTAVLVAEELGYAVTLEDSNKDIYKSSYDLPEGVEYVSRPPIVTVMGHVDHGKTTLLDYIRKTKQVDQEAGKITQHFGAYNVTYKKDKITFFDTPGHAAFSDMRARGAKLTDIVVLVVAADDGVKPQTAEAIRHAQLANASIVVAINKMDVEGADTEKVLKELASNGLQPEEWGGDIQCVQISAIKGTGVDKLLEAILAQASIMELKTAPKVTGRGFVIESSLDKNIGSLATVILQHGGMKRGDILLCGNHYGRIKLIKSDEDKPLKEVGSTVPVSILGLNGVPAAGDSCLVVDSEKEARSLIELSKELTEKPDSTPQLMDVEALLNSTEVEPTQNNLIIKADVAGSLEAIKAMINGLSNETTNFEIVTGGVGAISEGDISLARATGAIVVGFNVRTDSGAKKEMKRTPVPDVFYYNVIYELADQLDKLMVENLALHEIEKIIGLASVKNVFSAKQYGQIAGCVVSEGIIYKDKPIRVLREDKVIYEGVLESLKRFKENVQEVHEGVECGIGVKDYKSVKVGDQIEVYDKLPSN
ncbi:MAG: translation initiation factor IF-2 [Candidatus Portiera sp.]|nr:translation initiation factor IF-2 [Portiera sp.]